MKMRKLIIVILLTAALCCFAGCAGKTESGVQTSELRGTFRYSEDITTRYSNVPFDEGKLYSKNNIFITGLSQDKDITYQIKQKLSLKKDYTYNYSYSIVLVHPEAWNSQNKFRLIVDIYGTYTYCKLQDEENKYSVNLSNPTSGKEEIYGCKFNGTPGDIFSAELNPYPDFVQDFASIYGSEYAVYDEYVRARKVYVTVDTEDSSQNKLIDNVFYNNILDTFGKLSTY